MRNDICCYFYIEKYIFVINSWLFFITYLKLPNKHM